MSKISREELTKLRLACHEYAPEELYGIDMVCNLLVKQIDTDMIRMRAQGCSWEEIEAFVKPKTDLLKALLETKEKA